MQWFFLRPEIIAEWRQTDTQTIARHFTEPGANILFPRIDWGGAGPGYVETEFQLYTWIVAMILKVAGPSAEWPGQLVSLLAVLVAALVAFVELSRRYGKVAGAFGVAALLTTRAVVQTATSVQPEALCLLMFVIAWFALLDFTETNRLASLAIYALFGVTAMLVKPTAGQLGIASFILLLLQYPASLRRKEIWLAWAFMVGVLVLHLLHARAIYLEYGNTFGVLSGGESKFPQLVHLLNPQLLAAAATRSVSWGVGFAGTAALIAVLLMRRRSSSDVVQLLALLAGVVVWTLLALRYTTSNGGNHYHVLGAVLAAHAVAILVASQAMVQWTVRSAWVLAAILGAQLVHSYHTRLLTRDHPFDAPALAVSRAAAGHVMPGDLIVVRSALTQRDEFWRGPVQFADPRVFYLTKARGWPLARDIDDPALLERAARQGARYYLELGPRDPLPRLDAWLHEHAVLVASSSLDGKVFALPPQAASGPKRRASHLR